MKEIVLDTETTGLSTKEGHRIVEIGCIELDNLVPTKNRFHCYLNPDRKVSEKAFKVHGYTDEFLSKQKRFDQIVDEFLNFIKESRLVIHNAEFDLSHLNNEMKILGKEKIKNEVVDTLTLARNKFPGSSISLDFTDKTVNEVVGLIDDITGLSAQLVDTNGDGSSYGVEISSTNTGFENGFRISVREDVFLILGQFLETIRMQITQQECFLPRSKNAKAFTLLFNGKIGQSKSLRLFHQAISHFENQVLELKKL